MRRLVMILAATAAASALWATAGSLDAWAQSRFTSSEKDFSVAFPRPPAIERRGAETDDASGYRSYLARDGQRAFLVQVDQYPRGIPVPAPDPEAYELILRAYAVASASRLKSTTPVRLSGYEGLQGSFARPAGGAEIRWVVMVGRRIYQLSYAGVDADDVAASAPAFLDSFTLTPEG